MLPVIVRYLMGPWMARLLWIPAALVGAMLFKPLWFLIIPVALLIVLMKLRRRREDDRNA